MNKQILFKAALVIAVSAASVPAMAQSGSSGSSGSAGLGIDYGALVAASGGGNPFTALPGSSGPGMGGPIAGLARHFSNRGRDKK